MCHRLRIHSAALHCRILKLDLFLNKNDTTRRTEFRTATRLTLCFICFTAACGSPNKSPRAEKGRLDLSHWEVGDHEVINLAGQWQFYWNRLLAPESFQSNNSPISNGFMALPAYWNDYEIDGNPVGADGCATYRLQVRLPPEPGRLAIRIEDMATAYRLFVDGSLLCQAGEVGTIAEETVSQYQTHVVDFSPRGEWLELILHVANFQFIRGGADKSIHLAQQSTMRRHHDLWRAFDVALLGCLLVMALYHFAFFILRRRDRATFHLGLLCLCWAVWGSIEGMNVRLFLDLVPELPFELINKSAVLSGTLACTLVGVFVISLFPQESVRWAIYPLWIAFGVFAPLTVFTDAKIYNTVLGGYETLLMVYGVYLVVVLVRACLRRRQGARLSIVGYSVFFLTAGHDILVDNGILYHSFILPIGVFALVLSQALALALRFSFALPRSSR